MASPPHLWNGSPIWGTPTQAIGPSRPYRAQLEELPGVDGARIYQLGKKPGLWRVSGRLSAASLASLKAAVWAGCAADNGQVGAFTDSDGAVYQNCILPRFPHVE